MFVRPIVVCALFIVTLSCSNSGPAQKADAPVTATSHQAPKDLSTKFATAGQVKMQLIPDHLLGKDFLPGGNLADYKTEAGEFQLFLFEAPDARAAAFTLLDWKNALPDSKYIAHMGGYYCVDQGKQVFLFSKGPYLAGVVGLPEEKADMEGRKLAARL
jgi:hypothetical protein